MLGNTEQCHRQIPGKITLLKLKNVLLLLHLKLTTKLIMPQNTAQLTITEWSIHYIQQMNVSQSHVHRSLKSRAKLTNH